MVHTVQFVTDAPTRITDTAQRFYLTTHAVKRGMDAAPLLDAPRTVAITPRNWYGGDPFHVVTMTVTMPEIAP